VTDDSDVAALRQARAQVLEAIAAACNRVGRDPGAVQLVAISKTVAVERVHAAVAAGLTTLGENRVQEAEAKVDRIPAATWHLVGPLQSNKARRALAAFDVIESVDSLHLARRLDRLVAEVRPDGRPFPALLQVNVDDDRAKAGFDPAELEAALPQIVELPRLEIRGLMTIGRLVDRSAEARSTFVALRELSDRLRRAVPGLGSALSMGMSADYEVAVEEGATIVRVGQALFGHRPHGHPH
jgi:pyridoxal phosphate enzyme (YggS family)